MPSINTARELCTAIISGETRCEEVAQKFLEKVSKINQALNVYISVKPEETVRQAREADAVLKRYGPRSIMHGAPLAVKDIISVAGYPLTAGSRILGQENAKRDADCVFECRQAGLIVIGKTNLHEFASGPTGMNPHFGPTRNPWNKEYIAGGSSSGSAAAVSAGLAAVALGTDTGGSVRIPASICGVVGFKPTYGAINMSGVFPLAWSLDHVGILGRSVWDVAALFSIISRETSSIPLRPLPRGTRIGVPWGFFENSVDKEILTHVKVFVDRLSSLDIDVSAVEAKWLGDILRPWTIIRRSEASAIHRRWLENTPHLYSDDVLEGLREGMNYSAVDYIVAQKDREKLSAKMDSLLTRLDAILMPTVPIHAPRIADLERLPLRERLTIHRQLISLTHLFNLTGSPSISLPIGFTLDGLPVSCQLAARRGMDSMVLSIAYAFEIAYGSFKHPEPLF
jgi:aspartyl-tRNA(Asn)/glutamyl-tRNA(Gln) amidotransferase subunit A